MTTIECLVITQAHILGEVLVESVAIVAIMFDFLISASKFYPVSLSEAKNVS